MNCHDCPSFEVLRVVGSLLLRKGDGDDDDALDDDLLTHVQSGEDQPVVDEPDEDCTDRRAYDPAVSTEEAGSSQDNGSNDGEFVTAVIHVGCIYTGAARRFVSSKVNADNTPIAPGPAKAQPAMASGPEPPAKTPITTPSAATAPATARSQIGGVATVRPRPQPDAPGPVPPALGALEGWAGNPPGYDGDRAAKGSEANGSEGGVTVASPEYAKMGTTAPDQARKSSSHRLFGDHVRHSFPLKVENCRQYFTSRRLAQSVMQTT